MGKSSEKQKSGWFAKGGILASLFAVVGASCCILPIILINLGLSSALVSHLGFFARFRHWFMALSIMLIIGGIVYAYSGGRQPKRGTIVIFVLAAILTLGAYILPYYEGDLQRWLNLTSR